MTIVPGLKFSATTSALTASCRATAAPAGLCRSIWMLFLLRLNIGKKPMPAPSSVRVRSPSIGSTLITSAPRSASTMPQVGPITMWVNSTTFSPANGCGSEPRVVGSSIVRLLRAVYAASVIVLGKPARHRLPCKASPSSQPASCVRKAISRPKSSPVATPMLANK